MKKFLGCDFQVVGLRRKSRFALKGDNAKSLLVFEKKCAPLRTLLLYSAVLEGIPAFARPLLFLRDAPGRARPLLFLRDAQNFSGLVGFFVLKK